MISRREMLKRCSSLAIAVATLQCKNLTASNASPAESETDYTRFVNPLIGTGAHGHTYPGASVPFGMVQLSPDNGVSGWDWCSGYNYSSNVIAGFSHTHLSGTGIGDMCDILLMPTTIVDGALTSDVRSRFSHERESASPGYYTVDLLTNNIKAELTATERVGFHRYTFPSTNSSRHAPIIIIDLAHALNWDAPVETFLKIESPTIVSGYRRSTGWAHDQIIYFVAHLSEPIKSYTLKSELEESAQKAELRGVKVKAALNFAPDAAHSQIVLVKVGISAVNIEGARANLARETPDWNFDRVRGEAALAWNKELGKIHLETSDERKRKIFYTALYHVMLAPTLFCDVAKTYRGADKQIHETRTFTNYTTFSLWDTFRAAHPLFTIFQPARVEDFVQSLMAFYREHGLLPVWPLAANETDTMIGYHAIPVIVDAYFKKLTTVDPSEALAAMKKSALQDAHGLRFYKTPAPVALAQFAQNAVDENLRRIGAIQQSDLSLLGQLCAGYSKTLQGNTINYHAPSRARLTALIARTEVGKNIIEWETAPAPRTASDKHISFVWLAGLDVNKMARRFTLFVNDKESFTFNCPARNDARIFNIETRGEACLSFIGTHTDQYEDLFGYMFLTLPREFVKPDEGLRLRVVGEMAGTDNWYMTFEQVLHSNATLDNEFGFVEESGIRRQVVRVDVGHLAAPTDATVTISDDAAAPQKVRLEFGANTFFVTAPLVETETKIKVRIAVDGEQEAQIIDDFHLRPVRAFAYIPADKENESVSKTLEYAYDDWCIARLAKALGRTNDEKVFAGRAQFYRNLFDQATKFMRGRLSNGSWKTPFSPKFSEHRQDEYTEGNAWQYTWFVPHDVRGIIELMGGESAFIVKLDELFNQASDVEGTSASPDISGLIGQYAHGNEPSHHIAYLYAYARAPWKTQERVRQITRTLYTDAPEGLCGNDDCGQMSAWYVFSALGFYPVNPAEGIYVIGSPHFAQATINLNNGRKFTVIARNVSDTNIYAQSARLNGKVLHRCFIQHAEIVAGGELVFEMGDAPNKNWDTREVPPPMTPEV